MSKAADLAYAMIQQGVDVQDAINQAADFYGSYKSEVAFDLGKKMVEYSKEKNKTNCKCKSALHKDIGTHE